MANDSEYVNVFEADSQTGTQANYEDKDVQPNPGNVTQKVMLWKSEMAIMIIMSWVSWVMMVWAESGEKKEDADSEQKTHQPNSRHVSLKMD